MKNPAHHFPATRREFLQLGAKGAGLLAFSRFAPAFPVESAFAQAPAPEKDRTILVLVQLAGGNDGLNTIVPYADPNYRRLRPTLGLPPEHLLKLNDSLALNGACGAMHELLKNGKLGIVQNVGYPNPNRSHFRSTEIWETASESNEFLPTGWLGRFFDNGCAGAPAGGDPCGVNISNEVPQSFSSEHQHTTFSIAVNNRNRRQQSDNLALLEQMVRTPADHDDQANAGYLRHTMMDTLVTEKIIQKVLGDYQTTADYPVTPFANSLRNVAALIAAGTATRVYYVSLTGFDTHNNQANTHANLLKNLSEGLAAFQQDLESKLLDSQVITMTFPEFGRRPSENESRGTDHGTSAPLFVLGSRIKPGLHGRAPSLQLERNQDMQHSTDFRQVYATLLDKWLGCPAAKVMGKPFPSMDIC
ncbi:MAG: DUF1501 domain-containing protein [Lacunisphaera sp.]|nr:DUF1501 domain-containing protein [Lacunisphaera sp.]